MGSKEMAAGLGVYCSPFRVIPKKGRENKWRLIVDLTAPEGGSINDCISKEMSSLKPGGSTSGVPGSRYVAGEVGHMPGVQECPGAPARPPSPGGRVEGHGVRRFGAPVRLEICPTVVYGGGGCPPVDHAPAGGVMAGPLCGRFHNHGSSR